MKSGQVETKQEVADLKRTNSVKVMLLIKIIQQKPDPGPDPYVGLSGRLAVTRPFFKKGKV